MAAIRDYIIISLVLHSMIFFNPTVKCDDNLLDEEDNLLLGINSYRTSLNLTNFIENERAECFAEAIADLYENRPCSNISGVQQFSDYPNLITKCLLGPTNTSGVILPACVANLVPTLVLSNFTQTNYSTYLNSTNFTTAGIGSEDNWILVVLVADGAPTVAVPPPGSYMQAGTPTGSAPEVGMISSSHLVLLVVGAFFMM